MKTPKNHTAKLAELKLVSNELNAMVEGGSFYRLSFASRWAWIRRVKKLYSGLRGPIADLNLKPLLAAGAVSAAALLAAGCPAPGAAGTGIMTPAFSAPVTNPFNLGDVGFAATPRFVDIDNDGDLDAFVGDDLGNTRFFRNNGTTFIPVLAAEGGLIPFGLADVGSAASPCFVDIDNDGDLDAFIGNYPGEMRFFRNSGTASVPAFTAEGGINPFGLADVGSISSPCFVDIDHDGDLDAFLGNDDGETRFFRNTGTASFPAFTAEGGSNPFGLAGIENYATPCLVDIDNDGDLDAFIGNDDGETRFSRNTGTASFSAFTAEGGITPFGITDVGSFASPCFADIDNDGDLDAFVGNWDGNILFFRNTAR